MKKSLILFGLLLISMILIMSGCAHEHEWIEATCNEAKHCMHCKISEGEPLVHTWNEATCEIAKTCSLCGTTEGEPIGHAVKEWKNTKEATCSEEGERTGVCDRCQKECVEKTDKLPHTNSDWQVKTDFIINPDGSVTAGEEMIVCVVCNEEIQTRKYTAELTLSQKNAAICAYDELNFWHCGPNFLIHTVLVEFEEYSVSDAKFVVSHMAVNWGEQAVVYAEQNVNGSSKSNITSEMRHYGFNNEQINNALKAVGY